MNKTIKYGLHENDLNLIISVLKDNDRIQEIILFGSRAKGTYSSGSDIDIALKGKELSIKDIATASLALEELLIPNKIDLIIYNRIQEKALIEHINRVGISLFNRY